MYAKKVTSKGIIHPQVVVMYEKTAKFTTERTLASERPTAVPSTPHAAKNCI